MIIILSGSTGWFEHTNIYVIHQEASCANYGEKFCRSKYHKQLKSVWGPVDGSKWVKIRLIDCQSSNKITKTSQYLFRFETFAIERLSGGPVLFLRLISGLTMRKSVNFDTFCRRGRRKMKGVVMRLDSQMQKNASTSAHDDTNLWIGCIAKVSTTWGGSWILPL